MPDQARVYIETTVVSYLTALPTRDLIAAARQEITRTFRHLANPANRRLLRHLCEKNGYELPLICTPDEMMKGEL